METVLPMMASALEINTLQDLRNYVYRNICEHNELEPGIFQMTDRLLTRSGTTCGVFFCLYGPRSVRLTAIWESDGNNVLFYDSAGERTSILRLPQAPQLST